MNQKPYQAAWNKKNIDRRREWNRIWIRNNRDRYNASKARYRRKLKIEAMLQYCNPIACQQCGFTNLDALVLDHINHDGAQHRRQEKLSCRGSSVSGTTIYELIRRKGKIEGLQVLCANCNMIKELKRGRQRAIKDPAILAEIESLYGNYPPSSLDSASIPDASVESAGRRCEESGSRMAPPMMSR